MNLEKNIDKAFRVLCRNYACPGPDGVSIKKIKADYSHHREKVIIDIKKIKEYAPVFSKTTMTDFREKGREIEIYRLHDRWLQIIVKIYLRDFIYTQDYSVCWGTRPGFPEHGYIDKLFEMKKDYILRTDITDFYLNISKNMLIEVLSEICPEQSIIEFVKNNISYKKKGLPVGNALSPALADLYLMEVDSQFSGHYVRRSDDMFFALDSNLDAEKLLLKLESCLKKIDLELNQKKTKLFYKPKKEELI